MEILCVILRFTHPALEPRLVPMASTLVVFLENARARDPAALEGFGVDHHALRTPEIP
jgi:hypothetical protein